MTDVLEDWECAAAGCGVHATCAAWHLPYPVSLAQSRASQAAHYARRFRLRSKGGTGLDSHEVEVWTKQWAAQGGEFLRLVFGCVVGVWWGGAGANTGLDQHSPCPPPPNTPCLSTSVPPGSVNHALKKSCSTVAGIDVAGHRAHKPASVRRSCSPLFISQPLSLPWPPSLQSTIRSMFMVAVWGLVALASMQFLSQRWRGE